LLEMKLPGDLRIGLIQQGETSTVANAQSVLQEGDIVPLFGHPDSLFEAKPLFDPDSQLSKKIGITLLSGSEISISLVRLLSNPRFKIRVIEKDLELCRSLAESLPNVTFVHGEGTSLRVLEEEDVGSADFFIACSKDDEDNIMTCLQAYKLGAQHTMLAINRADYIEVLDKLSFSLGLELAVSPRIATANEVLRYIGKKSFIELEEGEKCSTCIIELDIQPNSIVSGKRIRKVKWPDGCVIVGQESNFIPRMPTGDDILQAGDSIIAIIGKEKLKEWLKLTK
ncbi:MAG: NAD-binding protein, partial [Opitutales bacterium]|nr:NAD-binding protein [Opitutales bacterium]